ncbi:MAG: S66 peptidase family protein [Patescibacteria group bacterium]
MKKNTLLPGDKVGIVAPSRPIHNIKKEIEAGIKTLEDSGFRIKKGKYLEKTFYYSAGRSEEKVADIHKMFSDPEVKAIICATGGSSSNQLLELLDFDLIKNNPKIFLGYSDITALLLSIYAKTGLVTYHGPTVYELSMLAPEAKDFFFLMLAGQKDRLDYPGDFEVLRPGQAAGRLIGGNLTLVDSLLATSYLPALEGSVLFWEEVGDSPARIDFKLQELRLSGVFDKINGMIVGHLSDCIDKKYPEDNRPIDEIILERTAGFDFPIIKVDYFGHDIDNFYPFLIGAKAVLDTSSKSFSIYN